MKAFFTFFSILIFISAGAQYKYLGTYDEQGVPDYLLERDQVSDKLLSDISASLPEGFPVPTFNPHLISAGYDNDIRLLDSADVWVTFIEEGAGYKNVLGFYTYDLDNPYVTRPQAEDITIVFPNVSKLYSGGGLQTGDKVQIGTFAPNTGIGWVLIANGWKDQVTDGNWILFSNPDFNPETLPTDRFHNVLLNDTDNDVIVLGFEDIRRDYASCDQDFNDAIFYVSANPIESIARDNFAPVVDSDEVSSANDGGLESNGSLSEAIAKRNYMRTKEHSAKNTRTVQPSFQAYAKNARTTGIHHYLPTVGFDSLEEVNVSSPTDLLDLTNAEEVFSADYYSSSSRIAAALVTRTTGAVYNHSKNICDRLNGSSIADIRYVTLHGVDLVYTEIIRLNGAKEYVSWFSAKRTSDNHEIYSYWNLDTYPEGDYLNFQIWGSFPAQVFHKANYILTILAQERELMKGDTTHALPAVFVKSGFYANGTLHLNLVNKTGATEMEAIANLRDTEHGPLKTKDFSLILSGEAEQELSLPTGTLFDAGISLSVAGENGYDALYLADGAWGVDYNAEKSEIDQFNIQAAEQKTISDSYYHVERNFEISGETVDVVNVFRNIKPGHLSLDASTYKSISFELNNDVPVEVVLVPRNLADWSERYTVTIGPGSGEYRKIVLALSDFKNASGKALEETLLQSIVFSFINTNGISTNFNISVKDIELGPEVILNVTEPLLEIELSVYPNPASEYISYVIADPGSEVKLMLRDLNGHMIFETLTLESTGSINTAHLPNGLYLLTLLNAASTTTKKVYIKN